MAQTVAAGRAAETPVCGACAAPAGGIEVTTLVVENMRCGGCMRSVEQALVKVPGVAAARVNLSAKRVTVTSARGAVSTDALVTALEKAGFKSAELAIDTGTVHRTQDQDLLRRLAVAGFAAMNIMLLSVSVWSGGSGDMEHSLKTLFHYLSALIALPAVAYAGVPFFRSALGALKGGRVNMDVPISLGVILATLMSLYQTMRGSDQVYFDAAITLLAFLLVGRLLDEQVRARASGAAANLLGLRSQIATVVSPDGSAERLSTKHVLPGMNVAVAAGERIAVDGVVRSGASDIDEALISGETRPRQVKAGDQVFAGTMNVGAPLIVEATRAEDNTLIAEIARMMAAAEQGRGRYVRLADRAARLYAPAVHILGAATFIGWMLVGYGWEQALTAAIAVLIITCPCALALAVPAVQVAASSRLFAKGVILKAADGLERLAETDWVVFDKTGTLTESELQLADTPKVADAMLARAASLAVVSRHPYSRAVVAAARARGLAFGVGEDVKETAGCGLSRATGAGEERLGSAAWCGIEAVQAKDADIWFKPARGAAVPLAFADSLREDAAAVAARLKTAGYGVEILSGDRVATVSAAARAAGIPQFRGEVRPDGKLARLATLKEQGRNVLMVGDGLNDAPALAAAHASVSPASAADISQTAADAVFQGSRLESVVEALAVAKAARSMSLQNFALAIGYNIVFVPLAMLGYVTPLIAAVAMSLSSITVTANAVRLRTRKLEL